MKKTLLLFLLLTFSASYVMGQPTQAEINKMIKDAQAEIDKLKKDTKNAGMVKDLPDLEALMKNVPKTTNQAGTTKNSSSSTAMPAKNIKLFNSLPKNKLSRQQLINFLSLLYTDLLKKLPAGKVKAAQSIISQLNKDAAKIAGTGILAWYQNAPEEAALLVVYAASQSPDDNTLNNCGAILNLCGLEDKAIPILKYVLANDPQNSTILNNIGQAYTGLGFPDTAMYYFMACIRQAPIHPEACGAMAFIEYAKGNIVKAKQYAEKSIKGAYSSAMAKFYRRISNGNAATHLQLQNRLSQNKYFELNGFKVPDNCKSWSESEVVYAQIQTFKKKIEAQLDKFKQLVIQNTLIGEAALAAEMSQTPFAEMAQAAKDECSDIYHEAKTAANIKYVTQISNTVMAQHNDDMALINKYVPLFKAAEKNPPLYEKLSYQKCQEKIVIDDKWFMYRGTLADRYKQAWMETDITFYNNMVYLTTMTAPSQHIFKAECASIGSSLLASLASYVLDNCNPMHKPNCIKPNPANDQNNNSAIFNEANCPINLEIPVGIGKMSLNCQRFKVEGGGGIIGSYEKNFITRESTVMLGVGISTGVPFFEAGAKAQLFIKFDGNNQPIDAGVMAEAEIDVRGVLPPDLKTGFTIGINSGFSGQPGALQGFFN